MILMDKMYYESIKLAFFGLFPFMKKREYRETVNARLIGTITSSLMAAYSANARDVTIAMIAAALFLVCHFTIYVQLYLLAKTDRD